MQDSQTQDSPTDQKQLDSLRLDKVKAKKNKNSSAAKKQSLAIDSNYDEVNDESVRPFSFTSPQSPSQQEAPYNPFSAQAISSGGTGTQVMNEEGERSSESAGQ